MAGGRNLSITLFAGFLSAMLAPRAAAVSDGAPASRGPLYVQSARASGMGMTASLLDDATVGVWWNPGMAALDRDARFNRTTSDFAEGLADDITMTTWSIHSGRIPIGPVDLSVGYARAKLDFGTSDVIDENGNFIRSFESYDKLRNIFIGASWKGMIGAGYVREHTESVLSPGIVELGIDDGSAEVDANSFGFGFNPVFRVDPGDWTATLWEETWTGAREPGFVIAPLFGWSRLHKGDDVVYNDQNQAEPQPEQTRTGYGVELRIDAGTTGEPLDPMRLLRLDFLWGKETAKSEVGSKDEIDLDGWELRIAGIYSLRRGNIDDPEGNIDDGTEGWGIGVEGLFPVGFRYDEAEVPQAGDLPDLTRKEFMLTADLLELYALLQR